MVCMPGEDVPWPVLGLCAPVPASSPSPSSSPVRASRDAPSSGNRQEARDGSNGSGDPTAAAPHQTVSSPLDGAAAIRSPPGDDPGRPPGVSGLHDPALRSTPPTKHGAPAPTGTITESTGGAGGTDGADLATSEGASEGVGFLLRWEMPGGGAGVEAEAGAGAALAAPVSRWATPSQIERSGGVVVSAITGAEGRLTAIAQYHWDAGELPRVNTQYASSGRR